MNEFRMTMNDCFYLDDIQKNKIIIGFIQFTFKWKYQLNLGKN